MCDGWYVARRLALTTLVADVYFPPPPQPAIKLLGFMRLLAEGDAAVRQKQAGPSDVLEVAGTTRFRTEVAQGASRTMRALAPLSAVDAAQWVDYWESVGMFAGGAHQDV